MNYQEKMRSVHRYLMNRDFPYHSVSVICHRDLGLHVLFMDSVRDKVDEDVLFTLKCSEFSHSFVTDSSDESWRPEPQIKSVT